ncbi:putative protein-lysine deacylase ABHD14B [Diadema setosum]|uniref:putative protein-lysine deacylase ABHD14B n=1 Tax=Diadema setosum TaxID=31175 RepID=UPI003B3AEBF5
MQANQQKGRMGSLLRHVTFKTAAFGFTSLLIAAVIFFFYPSEKSDSRALLSRVAAKDQRPGDNSLPAGVKSGVEEQVESTQQCQRIDLSGTMTWEELKAEALQNTKLTEKKQVLPEFDHVNVHYREVLPASEPKGRLLFLHGMRFSSLTWQDLGTLHYMACHGYRAVAIDLPGYGDTPKADIASVTFMKKVMEGLDMEDAVICSPSMSGTYSIPFLKEHPTLFKGYVPVAPVGTNKLSEKEYAAIPVQTLITYGETDESLGVTSLKMLKHLPNNQVLELKGAGHAAYLDKPLEFHQALLEFCDKVYS